MSLVWDLIEPMRPALVRAVFHYIATHIFVKADFRVFVHKITGERTVRLAPPLAKEIAALTLSHVTLRKCLAAVKELEAML